ncbi:M14 family zinc carboxypeptidase [Bizionia sp. M204]|uniref:M14 family zinc carboxypeptidase n=1 Tax=Bizionia sp. M204 TaxID=2675331 RepID=UPI00206A8D99|nr:M14 family zinc carboxypeptidase [Bizionia sp. M204]UPS91418.1 HYR domain-containing protein [Bizionia sp. M204]
MKLTALKLRTLTAMVVFLIASSIMQAQVNASRQADQYLSQKGEVTFSFQINDVSEIESMTSEMSILNYDPNTRTVYAWANTEQFRRFESSNRTFQVNSEDNEATGIVMSNELPASQNRGPYPLTFPLTAYPTYADYATQMQEFAINHPDICELVDIGGTTEGVAGGNKRLLFLKLSDNIGTEEAEPKVMYTSSIHGDEITGYPLMLNLINYFITAYKNTGHSDHLRIKNLIDNSEVWINPMANPDGTYYNNATNTSVVNARRANANNLDLNRNYPDNVNGPHSNGHTAYELETQHFMNLAANTHFVLSANFHGGVEVVNYPWDNTYDRHPDDDWFMQISREYADNAQANSPNGYMDYLNNGITHGADWYLVYGGRQDYMNFTHQCKETTMELSNTKLIPSNQLVSHWNYNREALIEYLIQGTYGFQGKVKDAVSGDPIEATIKLVGHDALGSHTVSSLPHGDFYRPVFAGTYNILIEADCYNSVTLTNETIANYQTKSLGDILLTPLTATAPSNLSTSGTNTISTNASWSATSADNFDIRYKVLAAPTWTEVLGVTNPYQITGLSPNTTYEFQVKSYCGSNSTAYSSSQQFTTTSPIPCIGSTISAFPYTETFDGGLGLWTQGLNDIPGVNYEDWTLNAGSTISTGTGPTDDFTGGGNYLYTEASDANETTNIGQNVTVTLISPCIDLTGYENTNFSFYYHMVGDAMGTISVEVSLDNGIIWNQLNAAGNTVTNTPILIGQQQTNQGSPWLQQTINLSNYDGQVIKLRFSGTTGSTWSSDMAIDQIKISADLASSSAPPTAICQNITVQLDNTGNATIIATDVDGGSTDDVAITNYDIDINSFDCSDIGTPVNITLTVTDADGQTDTCTATVTVVDQIDPEFQNIPANILLTCGSNQPTWTDPTATDNCDNTLTVIRTDSTGLNSGDLFPNGITTISYSVTDDSGNINTVSFNVNVTLDNQKPDAICQNLTLQLDANGNASITASQINNGSLDNCEIASITASQTAFTCADIGANNVTLTVTDANGNSDTCIAVVTITLQDEPTATNCWDNYVFNTGNCTWENQGTQPVEPTATNCWDNYVFNTGNCTWENQGTQPAEPTAINCWDNYVFNSGNCSWENQGTQPVEPTATNCWDNYVFNTGNCSWENQGSQPAEPTATNCWDNYVFNTGNCTWENQGSQPAEPTATNCWDNYVFNVGNCSWENQGTQPVEPTATNCWDNYVFNVGNCTWENQGSQPAEPTATNCWDNYVFNTGNCSWENQGTQPTEPTATNCWDNYVFNSGNCNWENQGTQPVEPTATNCWDNYVFNSGDCTWENQGTQPTEPTAMNCWDNFVFNTGDCAWENTGTQPTEPTATNCWDNYVFNSGNCTWENQGSQPVEPTVTNCWDNYVFNTGNCTWENQGSQPTEPTATNCWDNYVFNTGNCTWENQGSQPAEPTATNCWDNYVFNTGNCTWENQGSQPAEPTATNCWDNYVFNVGNCSWENQGTQPVEPTATNCWDNYVFNVGNCTWENQGTQPVEPTATNCWDNYVFNVGNCTWENQGTQPVEPTATNCWDNYVFNTGDCTWENQGTQPTEPTSLECWETATFNTATCVWDVTNDGDTVDPVCNIQNITVELDAFGNATITADQIDNGSTDACGIDTISVTPNTFDSNDIGDNNVVFTVTDNSGNTSNCNAIVTVMESTLSNPTFDYENVSIQPNPFNNYIQISLPTSIANDLFTIQLFDVNGRLVYNQIQSGKQGTLTVQGLDKLQQGPYFIKLINKNNGYSVVKKLIRF